MTNAVTKETEKSLLPYRFFLLKAEKVDG